MQFLSLRMKRFDYGNFCYDSAMRNLFVLFQSSFFGIG